MARGSAFAVDIEGLDQFARDLRAAGPAMPKRMGQANKKAAELVADEARRRAKSLGGSAAKGVRTLTSSAAAKQAAIMVGGPRAPWMWGAEFGAKRYRQFPAWRDNQWAPDTANGVGYFMHPAIRETRDEFVETYMAAVSQVAAGAFPD